MKESRSAAVYVLAFVSALHLATFSAITVYQFRRINYLERILTQPNEVTVLETLSTEARKDDDHLRREKRTPDQNILIQTIRKTSRETALQVLNEFSLYLLHGAKGRTGRQTSNNEMAQIFSQLANAELNLFDKYCGNDSKICTPGPPGMQGQKGEIGLKGDPGIPGIKGEIGLDGPKGEKGDFGLPGKTGSQGPSGPPGAAGAPGLKGESGALGLPGQVGPTGPPGSPGIQGLNGPKGELGLSGKIGPKGAVGPAGAAGATGLKGEVGTQGSPGPAGPQGPPGSPGTQGLAGPKGDPGVQGPPGQDIKSALPIGGPSCCEIMEKPSFLKSQQLMKVTEGMNVAINCDVRGSPFPKIVWSPDPSTLDSRYHRNGSIIYIDNVLTTDSSIFNCFATNALGSSSKQIVLEVFKHINVVETPHNHTVLTGNPVKLECKFTGNPMPTISWYHIIGDGEKVPVTTGVFKIKDGSQLQIISALPNDSGKYVCEATNGIETISREAYLITQGPPHIQMPSTLEVVAGTNAKVHCNAIGDPKPTTSWHPPPNVNNLYQNKDGDLVILNVQTKDSGPYQCEATNSLGTDSKFVMLQVKESPVVTISSKKKPVTPSSANFGIDCKATGESPLNIKWYHNGSPVTADARHVIFPDNTLFIHGVRLPNDLGKYMCVASNRLGSANETALVYEEKGPVTCDAAFAPCEVICGVFCPADCDKGSAPVYGANRYDVSSSVCRSGIHSGSINSPGGEVIWETGTAQPPYIGTTKNGVTSLPLQSPTSLLEAITLTT